MGNERIRLTALIALFAMSLVGVRAVAHFRPAPQSIVPDWNQVPRRLGGWTGTDGKFDPIYGTDPADTSLLRIYSRGNESPIIVYAGFYSDLSAILEVHSPEVCYPSQGWTILSLGKETPGDYRGKPIPASYAVVDKTGNERLVTWWYTAGAKPIETRIRYVWAMMALSTVTGRKDGSLVRLETPFTHGGETLARARIAEFQKAFLPALDQALPR